MFQNTQNILLVGEAEAGKTSLFTRYTANRFDEGSYETSNGVTPAVKTIEDTTSASPPTKQMIWDSSGNDRFKQLMPQYYNDKDIILVVVDITRDTAAQEAEGWINSIRKQNPLTCIYLVGNKCDSVAGENLQDSATYTTLQHLATHYEIDFFVCSAKTGENVDTIFKAAASKWAEEPPPVTVSSPTPSMFKRLFHSNSQQGLPARTEDEAKHRFTQRYNAAYKSLFWFLLCCFGLRKSFHYDGDNATQTLSLLDTIQHALGMNTQQGFKGKRTRNALIKEFGLTDADFQVTGDNAAETIYQKIVTPRH